MSKTETQTATDVTVVGAGLGGCLTALTIAKQHPDATVRVLSSHEGRFDAHSGLINVLGYGHQESNRERHPEVLPAEPIQDPFAAVASLPETHPYRVASEDGIRRALALFDETVSGYCRGTPGQNGLALVGNGRLAPALRYPATVQPGLISRDEPTALVGFEEAPQFDAELAAARLAERVSYEVDAITIELPVVLAEGATPIAVARALDDNETLRQVLADRIEEELDSQSRVGLPAVLGLDEAPAVHREIQETCYAKPFEIPLGRPSILGRRLQSQFFTALTEAGVSVERDCTVRGYTAENGKISELVVRDETGDRRDDADAFVLATGGIGAGGLQATRGEQGQTVVAEPLFDCHVSGLDRESDDSGQYSRLSLTSERLFDSQPFERVGLQTNERFQPLAADGTVQYQNLWAVGTCLAGLEPTRRGTQDGIELTTGYAVGRQLANER